MVHVNPPFPISQPKSASAQIYSLHLLLAVNHFQAVGCSLLLVRARGFQFTGNQDFKIWFDSKSKKQK